MTKSARLDFDLDIDDLDLCIDYNIVKSIFP